MYDNADIYFFDDPLSALDAEVGLRLFRNCIKTHLRTKTRLLVTHQVSVLPEVDRIILMDSSEDGSCRIIDQGTLSELYSRGHDLSKLVAADNNSEEDDVEVGDEIYGEAEPSFITVIPQEPAQEVTSEVSTETVPATNPLTAEVMEESVAEVNTEAIEKESSIEASAEGGPSSSIETMLCGEVLSDMPPPVMSLEVDEGRPIDSDIKYSSTCSDPMQQTVTETVSSKTSQDTITVQPSTLSASAGVSQLPRVPMVQQTISSPSPVPPLPINENTVFKYSKLPPPSASGKSTMSKLITAEDRGEGAVGWDIYQAYIKAANNPLLMATLIASFLLANIGQNGQQWIVAAWTSDIV